MGKITIKSQYKAGILSGFPRCCIVWFFLRSWFYVKPLSKLGKLRGKGWTMKEFDRSMAYTPHKHTGYVCCPAHKFLYWLNNTTPKWHKCECGWGQIGMPECRKCLSETTHE